MGGSGRMSKISSVIAVICIAIYIMAIAFGAAQIIESIGERRNLAEQEFYDVADRATSSSVSLRFMSDEYRETIRDCLYGSETLLAIIVTGSDNEYAFERYTGSGIVWAGDSPRFKTGIGLPREPYTMFLRIEGQRNASIKAIYSYIDYDLFVKVLKNTLLAVLTALTIAFITLMVEIYLKNKAAYSRQNVDDTSNNLRESFDTFSEPEPSEFDEPNEPDGFEGYDEPEEPDGFEEPEEPEETDTPFGNIEFPEDDNPLPETSTGDDNPQGLYSPRGNVGWESYTHDRLASEIHRCAAFEQDMVFIALDFGDAENFNDKLYRQFADEAVGFFTMRDLVFEKGEKGLSVIIPNMDLEEGFTKCEEFRSRIIDKLPDSFNGRTKLCAGLSSRSGRLIEAKRIMLEADTALEKAMADPASPIVGFKSDLEKYREFVRKHQT